VGSARLSFFGLSFVYNPVPPDHSRRINPMVTAVAKNPAQALASTTPTLDTPTTRKLRPLGDRVVIKPSGREEMTRSGIVIPDTAKEKPQEGLIIAVGPGRTLDDGTRSQLSLSDGDTVLYAKYAGTEFKIDGDELLIVSEKDVLAVIEA
jgi:chaperonin GroES